jgi:hypothetical protein
MSSLGGLVQVNLYSLHRNAQHWGDPDSFRFETQNNAASKKSVFAWILLLFELNLRKCNYLARAHAILTAPFKSSILLMMFIYEMCTTAMYKVKDVNDLMLFAYFRPERFLENGVFVQVG